MEEMIREIIAQADDERNFDLIGWVKDILDEFASAYNCPPDWRYIGTVLAGEYPADSWVYENLQLYNFKEIPEGGTERTYMRLWKTALSGIS